MKVNTNAPQTTQLNLDKTGAADKAKAAKTENPKPSQAALSQSSQVQISDEAKLMRQAADAVRSMPEVRADRVAALKKQIAEGTYHVDSADIADRLVDEQLAAHLGKNSL